VLFATGSSAALPLFQRAIEIDPKFAAAHTYVGRMYGDLGETALSAESTSNAAAEFQKIVDHRGIVVSDPIGALAHLQLGRAYTLSGDKTKAKSAYQDFLMPWKDADPDIPILKQAQAEHANLN
jgi:hypothetical protein